MITSKVKVLSLFSGIGAFEQALKNLGYDVELVGFSEIDKYAIKSYCAVHGVDESMNLGDVTKIDTSKLPDDIDMLTFGFPCQDISIAGRGDGFYDSEGNITRSGLFFDALRVIEATKPRIAIAENVKNLISKRFKTEFAIVLQSLEDVGYNVYWEVLNSKDFGMPQNRERVFIVCIRKDIDKGYEFPEGIPLEISLLDMLEEDVDEKFFVNTDNATRLINDLIAEGKINEDPERFNELVWLGNIMPTQKRANPNQGRIYDPHGLCPAMNCMGGGNREPMIIVWKE